MNKVLIFYGSYGGGHFSAAKSILECIENNYSDCSVEIIDCIEYINKFLNKISTKFYSSVAKNAPNMWGKIYYNSNSGVLSKVSNTANKIMARKLLKLIDSVNPDFIISTHPFSSNMCGYLKHKNKLSCNVATVITDYALHNQWLNYCSNIDLFFVAHEGMKNEIINMGVSADNVFDTGIPISPRFSQSYNKNSVLSEIGLNPDNDTILFFAGGEYGLGKHLTEKVFETLVSSFNNFQVIAIAGKNPKIKLHFEDLVSKYNRNDTIKVLPFTNKVPEFMSVSSFIVSKPGGLTTSESLASLLPMFIISPLPGQEKDNAKFIENNNCGYWLKDSDNLEDKLTIFINNLDFMKENLKQFDKNSSTNDICKVLKNRTYKEK